jgi:hypothetical protein
LTEGAVWPMVVAVLLGLPKHGGRRSLVDDQDAVEELAADQADEAFGNPHKGRLNAGR